MSAGNPLVPEAAAERLGAKVATLPTTPGVYLLKDGSGRVLYVGNAAGQASLSGLPGLIPSLAVVTTFSAVMFGLCIVVAQRRIPTAATA